MTRNKQPLLTSTTYIFNLRVGRFRLAFERIDKESDNMNDLIDWVAQARKHSDAKTGDS